MSLNPSLDEIKHNLYSFLRKVNYNILHKFYFLDLIIVIVLSILPFRSMGFSGIWNKTDLDWPFFSTRRFQESLLLWNEFSLGHNNVITHVLEDVDIMFLISRLSLLGFSSAIIQRLYLILIPLISFISMYYMVFTFSPFSNVAHKRVSAIIASTYYFYNPVVIMHLQGSHTPYLEAHSLYPLAFIFFHKGYISTKQTYNHFKWIILFSLCSIFILSSHPSLFIQVLFFFMFLTLFYVSAEKTNIKNIIDKTHYILTLSITTIMFNMWWLLPRLHSYFFTNDIQSMHRFGGFNLLQVNYPTFIEQFLSKSNYIDPIKTLYMQPYYWLPFPAAPNWWDLWINGSIFILLGLSLTIISFVPLLLKRHRYVFLFNIISIFTIGLQLSFKTNVGKKALIYLIENITLFSPLHNPLKLYEFGVISFSFLLGSGTVFVSAYIFNCQKKKSKVYKYASIIFSVAIFILILINSFPLLTENLGGMLNTIDVPQDYIEAEKWLGSQSSDFRILSLPENKWLYYYAWGPPQYGMISIGKNIFPQNEIASRLGAGPEPERSILFKRYLVDLVESNYTHNLGNLFNLANVKYIVVCDDVVNQPPQYSLINNTNLKNILTHNPDFSLAKTFGDLYFYLNNKYLENYEVYSSYNSIWIPAEFAVEPWYGLNLISNFNDSIKNQQILLPEPIQLGRSFETDYENPLISFEECFDTSKWNMSKGVLLNEINYPNKNIILSYSFNLINENNANIINDDGQYHNDGFLNGDDILHCYIDGRLDQSIYINGKKNYIEVNNLHVYENDFISLEFWVKVGSGTGAHKNIIDKRSIQGRDYVIQLIGGKSPLFWLWTKNGPSVDVRSETSIDDNKWHHLVFSYNGSHVNIFIDGIIDTSKKIGEIAINHSKSPLFVGGFIDRSVNYFEGCIDDLRIYNISLTKKEVEQHYLGNYAWNEIIKYSEWEINDEYINLLSSTEKNIFELEHGVEIKTPIILNGKLDVILEASQIDNISGQALVVFRYVDKDNWTGIKLHDANNNGLWDEYRPWIIENGEHIGPDVTWKMLPYESSKIKVKIFFFNNVVTVGFDLNDDDIDDIYTTYEDPNPKKGNVRLSSYRMKKVVWRDLKIYTIKDNKQNIDLTPSTISYIKVDSTKYRVEVHSDEQFSLILSTSYDTGWKVYKGFPNWLELILATPLNENTHYLTNGYANAWQITDTGDYYLTIYFQPQNYLNIGLLISFFSILLGSTYLVMKPYYSNLIDMMISK